MSRLRRVPALRDLLPHGPALSPGRRAALLAGAGASGARYGRRWAPGGPWLPLQVFGARYGLDLVLVSDHPSWDMHELARLDGPEGPEWLFKDSAGDTLRQSLVSRRADLAHRLPEIPLERHVRPTEVVDRSCDREIDLVLRYVNAVGEPVEVRYEGPQPAPRAWGRNGSTMGHSRDQVLVALDIEAQSFARRASVRIDGRPRPIARVAGLVPLQVALRQTQAGLSVGRWEQARRDGAMHTVHPATGSEQAWALEDGEGLVWLVQRDPWRTLRYGFRVDGDERFELVRAEVSQVGVQAPVCALHFAPALPDGGWELQAPWRGRWVLDVHGQPAHAWGQVWARPVGAGARVDVVASAPRWCTDRPLRFELSPSARGGVDGAGERIRRA